jgi:hypothetical protein
MLSSIRPLAVIKDGATFPVWNKAAANEFGRLAQDVGGIIEGSNTTFLSHANQCPKERFLLMDGLWCTSVPTKLKLTESASLWVAT